MRDAQRISRLFEEAIPISNHATLEHDDLEISRITVHRHENTLRCSHYARGSLSINIIDLTSDFIGIADIQGYHTRNADLRNLFVERSLAAEISSSKRIPRTTGIRALDRQVRVRLIYITYMVSNGRFFKLKSSKLLETMCKQKHGLGINSG